MSLFTRLFLGREQRLDHPTRGRIVLFKAKKGSYWESEPEVDGEAFSLALETSNDAPPSDAQVQFYQALAADPDAAFAKAAPVLVPEYEKWMKAPFPAQWRTAFKFVGMAVPVDGVETNPWELSFECLTDKDGHLFTCYFEAGSPRYVTIDG